ncbi:MAG: matrixin family metalloprotease, partial [Actinobacteria bacterium]|nr:matrixin family metalloprotease [Actinomycetota bacterium]
HTNADARFYYDASVGGSWVSPINSGYLAWDGTFGHEFNFIRETTDTSTNANVSITSLTICGQPTAIGCTSAVADGSHHVVEGSATIKFKSSMPSSLRDDTAAHEFGHYLGLGHSDHRSATMYEVVTEGQVSLHSADRLGRCQIYGHAHGYWGGC